MDRYELELRSQASSPSLSSPSVTATISSVFIPTIIHPQWISMIEYFLHYAYPIVLLAGIVFSLLILLALVQNVHMTSKCYLFVQTLFDLLFLMIGVCLYIPEYYPDVIPKFPNEKIYYHFLLYAVSFVVIWLFLITCLDHTCTAIQSSGQNEKLFCTPCSSKNSIVGIIFLGIVFSLPQLFAWESDGSHYRSSYLRTSFLYEHIYFWFLHVIYLFIPLFAIFVFMGTLLYTLCKKNEHYLLTSTGNHHGHYTIHYANPHETSLNYNKTRERENISKLFIFMCFLYLIFVLPYSFVIFFGKLFLREETSFIPKTTFTEIRLAYDLSLLLFFTQILMKFFVLTIFSGNFRRCLKKLLTCRCFCCCCRRRPSPSRESQDYQQDERIYMK